MCVFMSGFISSRMRARWCMGRCRLLCADDRQERKQRHRDHLEVGLFLGSNRRPARVPPLLVHVARCQGSLSWPDLCVVILRRDKNKPPATTRRSKIATITSERCRCPFATASIETRCLSGDLGASDWLVGSAFALCSPVTQECD